MGGKYKQILQKNVLSSFLVDIVFLRTFLPDFIQSDDVLEKMVRLDE